MQQPRWLLAAVAAVALYSFLLLVFGIRGLWADLLQLPAGLLLLALSIGLIGQLVLLARWHWSLQWLKQPLAWRSSASIFASGLALMATPGRSGEAMRALWLKQRHGMPAQVGVGITLSERLSDLSSALLVLGWGLGLASAPLLLIGGGSLLAGAALVTHPLALRRMEEWLKQRRWIQQQRRLHRLSQGALLSLQQVRQLMRPAPLLVATACGCLVWLVEANVMHGLFAAMEAPISLHQAAVIRTAMALGGVLSLLPAGLGTSEATAIGIAMAYGASSDQALLATLIIRISTLMVPCGLGWLSLRWQSVLAPSPLRREAADD